MPYRKSLQSIAAQHPESLLTDWRRERALRIGRTISYAGLAFALIGLFADLFWSPFLVILTDIILISGCALSIYWINHPKRPSYYWWPTFFGFWVSILPSLWVTGGLASPFFGVDLAALYVIGACFEEKNRSHYYFWFAFLHIPVFYLLEFFAPLSESTPTPLGLAAVITGATFAAIVVCVRSLLRSEQDIAKEFAQHFRDLAATEVALMRSDTQLREAQSIARIGNWEWNIGENRIYWSDELFEIFDVDKSTFDPSFEAYLSRLHPEMRQRIEAIINSSAESGADFSFENKVETKRHGIRYIYSRGRVLKDENGTTIRMWGTCQDITDRKHIEGELLNARVDLEKRVNERTRQLARALESEKSAKAIAENASQAKMQFLANMSHEMRTPMNSILGFAELLSDNTHNKEEAADYIRRIRTNGKQLLHLIDDILDLSKFEVGQIPVHKVTFGLRPTIDDIVHSFYPALEAKGLELRLNYNGDCNGYYISDAHRIQQVIMNLLNNSIKFSDQGVIDVEVTCQPSSEAKAPALLTVDVNDNGIGISPEHQQKLFIPFSQADSSVVRRFGGSGLGLAISKRISEALGGSLQLIASAPDRGSHFRFQIPLEPAYKDSTQTESKKTIEHATTDSFGLRNKKILLAEDAKDNAVLIHHYLRSVGVELDIATDGAQAVQMVQEQNYDCILMDIQMPNMDGLEATRILRAQGYKKPIIALTAHALPAEMKRSLEAGCTQHLTKPIKKADLIDTLNAHLGHYQV